MNVRYYQATDRQRCLEIFDSNTPKYFTPAERGQFSFWLDAHDQGKNAYQELLAEHYYVIEEKGLVTGCGGFGIQKDQLSGSMIWGMVDNAQHGKGFGKALFRYRLEQLRSLYTGYKVILDTSQHTFRFFEKFGFIVTNITDNGYGPGLHRYDMLPE